MAVQQGTDASLTTHVTEQEEFSSYVGKIIVVPPWDWTAGKVKTSVYTIGKKGVHDDTTTEIYSGVQSASRP